MLAVPGPAQLLRFLKSSNCAYVKISPSVWGILGDELIHPFCVGSRGAVVSAALSERKVAGSIPTIGDFHTVGPCNKAVYVCLATDVK